MAKATCSIDDCPKPRLSRGWCSAHYQRWKKYGDPTFHPAPKVCEKCNLPAIARGLCPTHYAAHRRNGGLGRTCSIDGCDHPHFGHGWCEMHYDRWKSNGDPLIAQIIYGDPVARFWSYVDRREPDTCWPWTSTLTHEGYGVIGVQRGQSKAHRFAYELIFGPIPRALDIDHICHNVDPTCTDPAACLHRRCVNPAHAQPVTSDVNTARANRLRAGIVDPSLVLIKQQREAFLAWWLRNDTAIGV